MKTTTCFDAIRSRPDRAEIRDEWIERAINAPIREERQADRRIRRWVRIAELENRYLRVILLQEVAAVETRELDENTVLDFDAHGNVCSITIEHASKTAGAPRFSYEQVAA